MVMKETICNFYYKCFKAFLNQIRYLIKKTKYFHVRKVTPITCGDYFHIYNRGINGCDLFRSTANYEHFLALYEEYMMPVADTYAWVLMRNHFHLLVRIKDTDEIGYLPLKEHPWSISSCRNSGSYVPSLGSKKYNPTHQIAHLFNAYAQSCNKQWERTGSLFEHPFKRRLISNRWYLKQVILYIHNNPVHHGFCSHPIEYPWNSYATCISTKPTRLKREKLLSWFDNRVNFKYSHLESLDIEAMENYLEL